MKGAERGQKKEVKTEVFTSRGGVLRDKSAEVQQPALPSQATASLTNHEIAMRKETHNRGPVFATFLASA
jgi:hypothetical protein